MNDHSHHTTVPFLVYCVQTSAFLIAQFRVMLSQATFQVHSSSVMELEILETLGPCSQHSLTLHTHI